MHICLKGKIQIKETIDWRLSHLCFILWRLQVTRWPKNMQDFRQIEEWAQTWGIPLSATTCYLMTIVRSKFPWKYNYFPDNHILEQISYTPYLGFITSDDLKWHSHISKPSNLLTSSWASYGVIVTLSEQPKEPAYKSRTCPILESPAVV